MDKSKWFQLWKALEVLSKGEDEINLFKQSITTLTEIFPDMEINYFKLNYKRNYPYQKGKGITVCIANLFKKDTPEELLSSHPLLMDCYSSRTSHILKINNETIYIFPLSFKREMQYIMQIKIKELAEQLDPIMTIFFNIFINFYYAVGANERDFLTSLYNRRAFDRVVSSLQEHKDAPYKQDFFILVDIDYFKKINDNFGHMIGDEVLILFSRILKDNVRTQDTIFRMGGEEFIILTRDSTLRNAFHASERFRTLIQSTAFPQVQKLTISIGFAAIDYPLNIFHTLKKADQALYYAKEHGRNQVYSYEWLVDQKKITGAAPAEEVMDIW